jgi:hypothetical protein
MASFPTRRLLIVTPRLETTGRLVRQLSEIPVELPPPQANPGVISMRFGRLTIPASAAMDTPTAEGSSGLRLYLFGLPWGLHFREMWDVVGRDLFGVLARASGTPDDDAMHPALTDFAGVGLLWLEADAALDNPATLLGSLLTARGYAHLLPALDGLDFSAE